MLLFPFFIDINNVSNVNNFDIVYNVSNVNFVSYCNYPNVKHGNSVFLTYNNVTNDIGVFKVIFRNILNVSKINSFS